MNERDLLTSFQGCDNLAPCPEWHTVWRGIGLTLLDQTFRQFPPLESAKKIVISELLSKFLGADDNGGRWRHAGT